MRKRIWSRAAAAAVTIGLATTACGGGVEDGDAGAPAYPSRTVRIMAPADPGGGWDQTARSMQSVMGNLVDQNVEVYNVGGAGGTIGLAQFVADQQGQDHELMVMGLVMVGAIQTNESPVTLEDVTPIARLTTEWEGIAVPADSKYQTLDQLLADFRENPRSISWGGGSAGGTDHILVGLLAKEAGVDPSDINYVAHSGGGEAISAILSGGVTVGVSGVAEFQDQVEAGEMRWLAVSSDEPIEGVDAPTIGEASDLDVVLPNWRGVVAPSGISTEARDQIVSLVTEMHDSDEWQDVLETNDWEDFFATGDEFAAFLEEERTRVGGVLKDIGLIE